MSNLSRYLIHLVALLAGSLLAVGQLVPGDTGQVAAGESLPQVLLWIICLSLIGTIYLLDQIEQEALSSSATPSEASTLATPHPKSEQTNAPLSAPFSKWSLIAIVAGLLCLVWIGLATWNVRGSGNLRFGVNAYWQWIAFAIIVFVVAWLNHRFSIRRPLIFLMIAFAWIASVHGLHQITISLPHDRARFEADPESVLQEAGIVAPRGSATYLLFEGRLKDAAPTGPFGLTNSLAGFIAAWLTALFCFWLYREKSNPRWLITLGTIIGVSLLICLILTKSRTAWLACMCGIALAIATYPRIRSWWMDRWKPIVLYGSIAIIGLIVAAGMWDRNLLLEAPRSLAYRAEYWTATTKLLADHPLFGIGPGNFQAYYAAYKSPLASETVADPHNFLFETAAVAGLPALMLLVIAILSFTVNFFQCGRQISRAPASHSVAGTVQRTLLIGGGVGAILVWMSMGALGPLPTYEPYLFSLPLAALGIWSVSRTNPSAASPTFRTSNNSDKICAGLAECNLLFPTLSVLLVHLLASGGWMTPGIGNSIAILLGLSLSAACAIDRETPTSGSSEQDAKNSSLRPYSNTKLGTLGAVFALVILGVFYYSTWLPHQAWSLASQQIEQGEFKANEDSMNSLALIDRWNPAPFRLRAELAYNELAKNLRAVRRRSELSSTELTEARQLLQEYIDKDRINWEAWAQAGYWEMSIAANEHSALELARDHFLNAAERYPSDIGCLTQLALVYWLLEDQASMVEYWKKADFVQNNNPHIDRKLVGASVYWPGDLGPASTRMLPKVWQNARKTEEMPAGWVRAEPVFDFLRTQLESSR